MGHQPCELSFFTHWAILLASRPRNYSHLEHKLEGQVRTLHAHSPYVELSLQNPLGTEVCSVQQYPVTMTVTEGSKCCMENQRCSSGRCGLSSTGKQL